MYRTQNIVVRSNLNTYLKIFQGENRIAAGGKKIGLHKIDEVTEFKNRGTSLSSKILISSKYEIGYWPRKELFSNWQILKSKLISRKTKIGS